MGETVNPRTQRYLKSFGLEPERVSQDGWDESGYYEFVVDDEGRRVLSEDGFWKVWRSWPEGFDTERLADAWEADQSGGQWTRRDWYNYYLLLLKIEWGSKTPRQMKKLRRDHGLLVEAVEGILKNG